MFQNTMFRHKVSIYLRIVKITVTFLPSYYLSKLNNIIVLINIVHVLNFCYAIIVKYLLISEDIDYKRKIT